MTEMGLARTLEKPTAAETIGGPVGLELVEARPAQNLLTRGFEQAAAHLAKGREKREFAELGAPGSDSFQRIIQEVSDSAFSWQSIQ
jgi:hypothetical protein